MGTGDADRRYAKGWSIARRIHLSFVDEEVLEWWLVTPYLARKLKGQGEIILEAYDCHWWGRLTSGQAIYFDSVIQSICHT